MLKLFIKIIKEKIRESNLKTIKPSLKRDALPQTLKNIIERKLETGEEIFIAFGGFECSVRFNRC